jgi:hypothetical protein
MLEALCFNKKQKFSKNKNKNEEKQINRQTPEKKRKEKTDPFHHRDGCKEDE